MVISSVTTKTPLAILSLLVFTHHVKTMALISKEKLIPVVNNVLLSSIACKKSLMGEEGAFQK